MLTNETIVAVPLHKLPLKYSKVTVPLLFIPINRTCSPTVPPTVVVLGEMATKMTGPARSLALRKAAHPKQDAIPIPHRVPMVQSIMELSSAVKGPPWAVVVVAVLLFPALVDGKRFIVGRNAGRVMAMSTTASNLAPRDSSMTGPSKLLCLI